MRKKESRAGDDTSLPDKESYARAFELAFFLLGDKRLAEFIAREVSLKLNLDFRLMKKGRESYKAESFYRVKLNKVLMLDKMVYTKVREHEPVSLRADGGGGGLQVDERTMIVRYISEIVSDSLNRDSFYLAIGLLRILFNYETEEVRKVCEVLIQNPDVPDADSCRRKKSGLMKKLQERFNGSLEIIEVGGQREQRFRAHVDSSRFIELVQECLNIFTPRKPGCFHLPPQFDPLNHVIAQLQNPNGHKSHSLERLRMHMLIHPPCLEPILNSLKFLAHARRLEIPLFQINNEGSVPPSNDSSGPNPNPAENLQCLEDECRQQQKRRERISPDEIRVLVDNVERGVMKLNEPQRLKIELEDGEGIIEFSGQDKQGRLCLGLHFLSWDSNEITEEPEVYRLAINRGRMVRFDITYLKDADGDAVGAVIDCAYQASSIWSRAWREGLKLAHEITESAKIGWVRNRISALVPSFISLEFAHIFGLPNYAGPSSLVLPFKYSANQSSVSQSGFMPLSLADAVIDKLSPLPQFGLLRPARDIEKCNPHSELKAVGEAQKVDYVISCAMRQDGTRIHAEAKIMEVKSGQTWEEPIKFDGTLTNLCPAINSISKQIAQLMARRRRLPLDEATLERLEKCYTENPEAERSYQKGRFFLNKFTEYGLNKAIKHFKAAIRLDKQFAKAYAGLANCYIWKGIYNLGSPKFNFKAAKYWAERALVIDDSLAEVHSALGYASMFYDRDWLQAEREFRRAIELNPNHATAFQGYAHLLTAVKRYREAEQNILRALAIDPFSPIIHLISGFVAYYSNQLELSLKRFQQTVDLAPSYHGAWYGLALVNLERGDVEQTRNAAREALYYSRDDDTKEKLEIYVDAIFDEEEKAREQLARANQTKPKAGLNVSLFHVAAIYAALKEYEQACACLEEAYEIKDPWLVLLQVEPRFAVLRGNERFDKLLLKLKYPPTK